MKIAVSVFIYLTPTLIGVLRYRSLAPFFRWALFYIAVVGLIDITGYILAVIFSENRPLYHLVGIVVLFFLTKGYETILHPDLTWKNLRKFGRIMLVLAFSTTLFIDPFFAEPTITYFLSQSALLIYCMFYLKQVLHVGEEGPVWKNSYFLFTCSCILYYTFSIVLHLFRLDVELGREFPQVRETINLLNVVFFMIHCFCIALCFLLPSRRTISTVHVH